MPLLNAQEYVDGIKAGDRVMLARAITLIESNNPKHTLLGSQVVDLCWQHRVESYRIGITGTPGVGKSTTIEQLGLQYIKQGRKVAVLAIDPSSSVNHGSILGDKTRMELLSRAEEAFIRPTPAGKTLGGVARCTYETIILCEAAGYDRIIVETVGVGQSEVSVKDLADIFVLLLLPGGGDELQGIKRGVVEAADIIIINKAEDDRLTIAKQSARHYRNALHLFPPNANQWTSRVLTCSALTGAGLDELFDLLHDFYVHCSDGLLNSTRQKQATIRYDQAIRDLTLLRIGQDSRLNDLLLQSRKQVVSGSRSPYGAAEAVIQELFSNQFLA